MSGSGRTYPPLWRDIVESLALVALFVWLILGPVFLFTQSPNLRDFQTFYASAHAWLKGADLYASTGQNMNPPAFVVLTAPLALLPIRASLVVWWILNAVAAGVAVRVILAETGIRPQRWHLLLALAFAGTKSQIFLGQTAWLLMLPATLGWRAYRRGDDWRAGAWWGLVIALKPIFFPLLFGLFWRRRYRAFAAVVASGAAVCAVGLLGDGIAGYMSWLKTGHNVYWFYREMNGSIFGALSRFRLTAPARFALWTGLAGMVVAATWRRGQVADEDADILTWVLVSLLVAPLGWMYYLPLGLGPLVAAIARHGWRPWYWLGVLGLFWPPGVLWAPLDARQTPILLASLYAISMAFLWWLATGPLAPQRARALVPENATAVPLPAIQNL